MSLKVSGAAEACLAHNQKVGGSKPPVAILIHIDSTGRVQDFYLVKGVRIPHVFFINIYYMFNVGDWKISTNNKGDIVYLHKNVNTEEYELVKIIKVPKNHKKKKTTLEKLKKFGNKLIKK